MKTLTKILLWTVVVFVAIQFIPVDRKNVPVKENEDFVKVMNTPSKIESLMKNSCYDCHTNETKYPQYAYVAPVSWSVKHHVNKGREHANFSIWATYNKEIKQSILENTIEMVRERKMPLPGYLAPHPEANLTKAERKLITNYFEAVLKSGNF